MAAAAAQSATNIGTGKVPASSLSTDPAWAHAPRLTEIDLSADSSREYHGFLSRPVMRTLGACNYGNLHWDAPVLPSCLLDEAPS